MESGSEKQSLLRASHPRTPDVNGRNFFENYLRPCIAEFIGTTMFVFIGSMTQQNELLLAMAIGSGLAYAMLVSSFGRLR